MSKISIYKQVSCKEEKPKETQKKKNDDAGIHQGKYGNGESG